MKLQEERLALKPDEAAQLLSCHPNSIRKWAREGKLKSRRMGSRLFIPVAALEAFVNGDEQSQ